MASRKPHHHFSQYREWQWIKHLVLKDYLVPWAQKLGSIARDIYVVDAFAGAGIYQADDGSRVEGSPLIIANAARKYAARNPGKSMHAILVEQDPEVFRLLSEEMEPYRHVATLFPGDFAESVNTILRQLSSAPALLLLDPFGLKDITAARCRDLLSRHGKTDVFIIVIMTVLHRTAGQLRSDGTPDPRIPGATRNARNASAFFDSDDWIPIALSNLSREQKEVRYLHLYFERGLGNRYPFKCAYPVRPRLDGKVKYWLVGASAHRDAIWLINDGLVKVDEIMMAKHYQAPGFLPGFGQGTVEAYRSDREQALKEAACGFIVNRGTSNLREVEDQLLPEQFGLVKHAAYTRVVKALAKEGRIHREQQRFSAALPPHEKIWA